MKLTQEEEVLLEIEKFLIEMKNLLNIKDISVQLFNLGETQMKFNQKKGLAPLAVMVIREDDLKSEYFFQIGDSDDQYPQTDKVGNHIDYLDMKNLIQEKLPITFRAKAVYKNIDIVNYNYKIKYSTLDENSILKAIKIKNEYIALNSSLINKKQEKKLNLKV